MSLEVFEPRQMLAAALVISEFMASNDTGLRDEDQRRSDWIEVYNPTDTAVDLDGWFLTDDAADLDKWRFPAMNLGANQRIVVFASGNHRRNANGPLHTNFRLDAAGEYLALVEPDGVTVAFDLGATYPPQTRDVSFGIPQAVHSGTVVVPGEPGRMLVPTSDALQHSWTMADYDDTSWMGNVVGIGYERSSGYEDVFTTDTGTLMYDINRSVYVRYPFNLDQAEAVYSLTLSMRYDDGYVAYINGQEVARRNAPADLTWNSGATAAHRDRDAVIPEDVQIDVGQFPGLLHDGRNVLAIHALNDDIVSSDFLMLPQLTVSLADPPRLADRQYFTTPTPGAPNHIGSTTSILEASHQPQVPRAVDPLNVTARTWLLGARPDTLTLHYRVMFGEETSVPMFDDGSHGDGAANDGMYGATLPAGLAAPGQMIRYRITAEGTSENSARLPVFADPLNSEQYFGTVVENPSSISDSPVIHLFIEDPEAANVQPGTRGALFHEGRLYDNIEIDPTGRTVGLAGPKKSHDIFFTSDHWFELNDGQVRMNDFDIISDYWNREKLRVPLGYQTLQDLGTPAHLSFPVRVEQNGEFYATYFFVDGGNEQFLERAGLDPNGALYKMNLGFSTGQGTFKKHTRTWEDISDLIAFFDGLELPPEERVTYLLDNVNIPAMINFLVGLVVMGHGDCCGKNLYIYRDTEGTGQWQALPWDVDSAFGRGGVGLPQSIYPDAAGIFSGRDNPLIASLLDEVPGFREMYLRRLRTLMDEFLQPPGTPAEALKFERRIDELAAQIAPDAQLDFDKWGSWIADPVTGRITHGKEGVPTWEEEVAILRNGYFPARREFLYNSLTQVNGGRELEPQVGAPPIEIGRVEHNPASTNQDEEYLELKNPNATAVDISGWRLTGGIAHTFAPGTVLPAGGTLYVSPNVNAFRARQAGPSGGQNLFVQGNYQGRISNHGSTIQLVAVNGEVVDDVATPADPLPVQQYLRISEVMFHPRAEARADRFADDDFEFIELVNTSSSETLDLRYVMLSEGVQFQFPAISLPPLARIVVVQNQEAFERRYGDGVTIAGQYGGTFDDFRLSNSGERLRLEAGSGELIQEFAYEDTWLPEADGQGYSLTIANERGSLEQWNAATGWRLSSVVDGTPGRNEAPVGDFNTDGQLDGADIELFCGGFRRGDAQFDLNGDRTVTEADLELLIEGSFGTTFGDASLDGVFNSRDLVMVLQSGEFEDSAPGNSTWAEGDWNCDGEFLTSDLVIALQYGEYLAASRPQAASTAPPPNGADVALAQRTADGSTEHTLKPQDLPQRAVRSPLLDAIRRRRLTPPVLQTPTAPTAMNQSPTLADPKSDWAQATDLAFSIDDWLS